MTVMLLLLAAAPALVAAQDAPTPIAAQASVTEGEANAEELLDGPAQAPKSCPPPSEFTDTATAPLYDYVVMLDISRSMRGVRGLGDELYYEQYDIWPAVQASATQYLEMLDSDAAVYIVPFSGGVIDPETGQVIYPLPSNVNVSDPDAVKLSDPFYLSELGQRQAAVDLINGLYPDSEGTFIAQSMDYALKLLRQLKADDDRQHVQTLMIYTDGIGNGPGDEGKASDYPENPNARLPEILGS
ncbi:MAG: vWA domain-containing protein, partial [Thermomicrobiales bacterium]